MRLTDKCINKVFGTELDVVEIRQWCELRIYEARKRRMDNLPERLEGPESIARMKRSRSNQVQRLVNADGYHSPFSIQCRIRHDDGVYYLQ